MEKALESLLDSLLYEGYALYPYTPGATKNATPTPFGIVYPPAYAAGNPATFDHLRMECLVETGSEADARRPRSASCSRRASATRPARGGSRSPPPRSRS